MYNVNEELHLESRDVKTYALLAQATTKVRLNENEQNRIGAYCFMQFMFFGNSTSHMTPEPPLYDPEVFLTFLEED